jgi:hypothetical protein
MPGVRRGWHRWTPEEDEFLRENRAVNCHAALASLVEARFGWKPSVNAVSNRRVYLGLTFQRKWTPEEDGYLRDNRDAAVAAVVAGMVARFGWEPTRLAVSHRRMVLGLTVNRRWSPEEDSFLRERYGNVTLSGLAEMLEERFGVRYGPGKVRDRCARLGLVRFRKTSYSREVKDAMRAYLKGRTAREAARAAGVKRGTYHKILWRLSAGYRSWHETRGPLRKSRALLFLDGDMDNAAPGNVQEVSASILGVMRRNGLISVDPEITRANLAICMIEARARKSTRLSRRLNTWKVDKAWQVKRGEPGKGKCPADTGG